MDKVFPRLYLYLLSGQAALVNQCIPQAEALFEAAINLVAEVPEYEGIFSIFLPSFLSMYCTHMPLQTCRNQ